MIPAQAKVISKKCLRWNLTKSVVEEFKTGHLKFGIHIEKKK
jgi:hypothetical protein